MGSFNKGESKKSTIQKPNFKNDHYQNEHSKNSNYDEKSKMNNQNDNDYNPNNPFVTKGLTKLTLFELNLDTGSSHMEILIDDVVEFPVISQDLVGYPNQFTYLSLF